MDETVCKTQINKNLKSDLFSTTSQENLITVVVSFDRLKLNSI